MNRYSLWTWSSLREDFFFFLYALLLRCKSQMFNSSPGRRLKRKDFLEDIYLCKPFYVLPFLWYFTASHGGGRTADLPKHNLSSIEGSTSFWTIWIPCCFVIAFSYFVFIDLAFVQASHPATDVGIATENIRLPLVQFRNQIKTLTFLRTVRHFVVRSGRGVVEGT